MKKQIAPLMIMLLAGGLVACSYLPAGNSSREKPSSTKADESMPQSQGLVKTLLFEKEPETSASAPPPRPRPQTAEANLADPVTRPPAPPQPVIRPGECWVQAVINPRPLTKPVDIVVRDAVNDITVTPAEVRPVWKKVTVREGGITYRIEPPTYKPIREKLLVRPEVRRTVVVPAVYEEKESVIEVEAERTVLERCKLSAASRTSNMPVQTLCARLIPAKTKTLKRKILVQPETTREVVEPAVYREITRWVIDKPARAVPVNIRAEMGSVRVHEITRPESIDEQQLPPEVRRLTTTLYDGTPSLVFRRVVCDHELTPELVERVQKALQNAGFEPGPVDGKYGKRTHQALLEYQQEHGLASGALTIETIEQLGVPYP